MNSHLNVADYRNTLPNLVELIHTMPPARRGAALQSSISFRPSQTLDQEFAIGPVRAAFANYWEARFCRPLPLEKLRRALEPPVPIKTLLEFSKFSITRDVEDIEFALQQLVKHLHERFAELDGSLQQWLFDANNRCHEVKPLPVGRSVNNLQELVECGQRFPTIYADPPWPYENEASRAAACESLSDHVDLRNLRGANSRTCGRECAFASLGD